MDFAKKKNKPVKKNSKLAALLLKIGVFLVVVTAVFGFLITRSFDGRFNVLLIGKNILLVSLESNQSEAVVVAIPENTTLTATYNKGSVLAGSLYKLDNVSKLRGKLIDTTIREFLGTGVDGYILVDQNQDINTKNQFLSLLGNNLSLTSNLFPSTHSDLSYITKSRFIYNLSKIRPDRIKFVNLDDSSTLISTTLPDGSVSFKPDLINLDSYLNGNLHEWNILKEGLSISVLNGEDTPGLATKASRVITNIGGNVIQVSESKLKVVNCLIYSEPANKNSYTLKRISKIFNCEYTQEKVEGNRADIAVIVGTSYSNQLTYDSN